MPWRASRRCRISPAVPVGSLLLLRASNRTPAPGQARPLSAEARPTGCRIWDMELVKLASDRTLGPR